MKRGKLLIILSIAVVTMYFFLVRPFSEHFQRAEAALTCYWSDPGPPMSVPMPRDPRGASRQEGPQMSSYNGNNNCECNGYQQQQQRGGGRGRRQQQQPRQQRSQAQRKPFDRKNLQQLRRNQFERQKRLYGRNATPSPYVTTLAPTVIPQLSLTPELSMTPQPTTAAIPYVTPLTIPTPVPTLGVLSIPPEIIVTPFPSLI